MTGVYGVYIPSQAAWQLGTGLLLGVPVGIFLFWLVTRGDPSVPNAIVPLSAISALVVGAAAAVMVIRIMHGPAAPAASSRAPMSVEL